MVRGKGKTEGRTRGGYPIRPAPSLRASKSKLQRSGGWFVAKKTQKKNEQNKAGDRPRRVKVIVETVTRNGWLREKRVCIKFWPARA